MKDLYRVGPFVMHDGRPHPGGIVVQIVACLDSDNTRCIAQHMRPIDGGGWAPGMSAAVPLAALTPLRVRPVQLELFPVGGER